MTINLALILLGKLISFISRLFNKGNGSTWPGHIALSAKQNFIEDLLTKNPKLKIILVVGTNGKTTTSALIASILKQAKKEIFQNYSGANLLNGIASSLLLHANLFGKIKEQYAIFEVDENALPVVLEQVYPFAIVALNLFRDQLDRYGELDSIAKKWKKAMERIVIRARQSASGGMAGIYPDGSPTRSGMTENPLLILNADDPLVAYLGIYLLSSRVSTRDLVNPRTEIFQDVPYDTSLHSFMYFGLPEKEMHMHTIPHAADSIYCPRCTTKLSYSAIAYSHLGVWKCTNCALKRPDLRQDYGRQAIFLETNSFQLRGVYNQYNIVAAAAFGKSIGLSTDVILQGIKNTPPAFGRQEVLQVKDKFVQVFLAKNPTSFNQCLETIINLESRIKNPSISAGRQESRDAKVTVLFVLNDRIPDGLDVSWIWDIELESYYDKFRQIIVSGDRAYDMALRIEYAKKSQIPNPKSQKNTKYEILDTKYIIEPNLEYAITKGLEYVPSKGTLYILPTYSAMLEVRKILTGKSIL